MSDISSYINQIDFKFCRMLSQIDQYFMHIYLQGQFLLVLSKLKSVSLVAAITFIRAQNDIIFNFSQSFFPFNSFLLTISFDKTVLKSITSLFLLPPNGKIELSFSKSDEMNDFLSDRRSILSYVIDAHIFDENRLLTTLHHAVFFSKAMSVWNTTKKAIQAIYNPDTNLLFKFDIHSIPSCQIIISVSNNLFISLNISSSTGRISLQPFFFNHPNISKEINPNNLSKYLPFYIIYSKFDNKTNKISVSLNNQSNSTRLQGISIFYPFSRQFYIFFNIPLKTIQIQSNVCQKNLISINSVMTHQLCYPEIFIICKISFIHLKFPYFS
jgi:hypothetical protein